MAKKPAPASTAQATAASTTRKPAAKTKPAVAPASSAQVAQASDPNLELRKRALSGIAQTERFVIPDNPFSKTSLKVTATRMGYDNSEHRRRRPGSVWTLKKREDFRSWMEWADPNEGELDVTQQEDMASKDARAGHKKGRTATGDRDVI